MFMIKNMHIGLYKDIKNVELMSINLDNIIFSFRQDSKRIDNSELREMKLELQRSNRLILKTNTMKNNPVKMQVNGSVFECTFGVKYFNYKLLEMEPFIENWSLSGRLLQIEK